MLKFNRTVQFSLLVLIVALVTDFFVNVWVGAGNDKRDLKIGDWDSPVSLQHNGDDLPAVNKYFGLKAEVDEAAEALRREQEEAERLAQEKAALEAKKQEVLTIGKEDIRLFGVSMVGTQRFALFKVKGQGDDRTLKLKAGEALSIRDETFTVKIIKVAESSVRLDIHNIKANHQQIFDLALFTYEF